MNENTVKFGSFFFLLALLHFYFHPPGASFPGFSQHEKNAELLCITAIMASTLLTAILDSRDVKSLWVEAIACKDCRPLEFLTFMLVLELVNRFKHF